MASGLPKTSTSGNSENDMQNHANASSASALLPDIGSENENSAIIDSEAQEDDNASESTEVPEQPTSAASTSSSAYSELDESEGPLLPRNNGEDEEDPVLYHQEDNDHRFEVHRDASNSRSFDVFRDENNNEGQQDSTTSEDVSRSFQAIVGAHPHAAEEEPQQENERPTTPPTKPRKFVKFSPRTKRRIDEEAANGYYYEDRPTRLFLQDDGQKVWYDEDGRYYYHSQPPRHDGSTGTGRSAAKSPLSPGLSPVVEDSSLDDDIDDLHLPGSDFNDVPARSATPEPEQLESTEEDPEFDEDDTPVQDEDKPESYNFEDLSRISNSSKNGRWADDDEDEIFNSQLSRISSRSSQSSLPFSMNGVSYVAPGTDSSKDLDEPVKKIDLNELAARLDSNLTDFAFVPAATSRSEDSDEPQKRDAPSQPFGHLPSSELQVFALGHINSDQQGAEPEEEDESENPESNRRLRPQPGSATLDSPLRQDQQNQAAPDSPEADSPQSGTSLEILRRLTGLDDEESAAQSAHELNRELAAMDNTRPQSAEEAGRRLRLKRAAVNIEEEELASQGRLKRPREINLPEDPVELMRFMRIRAWEYRGQREEWKRKYEQSEGWRHADSEACQRRKNELKQDRQDLRDALGMRNQEIDDLRHKLKVAEEDLKWSKSDYCPNCNGPLVRCPVCNGTVQKSTEDGGESQTENDGGDDSCEGKCKLLEKQLQEQKKKTWQVTAEREEFVREMDKLMELQTQAVDMGQKGSAEQEKKLRETERLLQMAHLDIIKEKKRREDAERGLAEMPNLASVSVHFSNGKVVRFTDVADRNEAGLKFEKAEPAVDKREGRVSKEFCNVKEHAKFKLDNPDLANFNDNKMTEALKLDKKIWALEEKVAKIEKPVYVDRELQTEDSLLAEAFKHPFYVDAGFSAEDEALFPTNVAYEKRIEGLNDEIFELKKKVRTFRDASRERDVIEETGELERYQKGYKNHTTQTDGAEESELLTSLEAKVQGLMMQEESYRNKIMDLEHELDTKEKELKKCREQDQKKSPLFSPAASPAQPDSEAGAARYTGSSTYQNAMAAFEQRRRERQENERAYNAARDAAIENLLGRKPREVSKQERLRNFQEAAGIVEDEEEDEVEDEE